MLLHQRHHIGLHYCNKVRMMLHISLSQRASLTCIVGLECQRELYIHSSCTNLAQFPLYSTLTLIVFVIFQSQFRSQGTPLIPEGQPEQALMYQRMFEGQILHQKLSM